MSPASRLLFFKPGLAWPRQSGHDVHAYHMMRALAALGARVGFLTVGRPVPEALAGLELDLVCALDECACGGGAGREGQQVRSDVPSGPLLGRLEERFRSYWGVPERHLAALGRHVTQFEADAVVVVGLGVLPLLGAVHGPVRVWYAADEWVWHHVSQLRWHDPGWRENLRSAVVKGMYERVYRRRIDRAWVVTRPDARAMRWLAGVREVDVLPNGVDAEWYRPVPGPPVPDSAVFWGRLDFGPNIQGLQWFCRHVWPAVRRTRPSAVFTIAGFQPGAEISELAGLPGVQVVPDLPDLRAEVSRHAVAVLPFVSGGGIKNKLLEAAALGKAIVASPRAATGLKGRPPIRIARTPAEWRDAILALWADDEVRLQEARAARAWVVREHTWESVARLALDGIADSLRKVPSRR